VACLVIRVVNGHSKSPEYSASGPVVGAKLVLWKVVPDLSTGSIFGDGANFASSVLPIRLQEENKLILAPVPALALIFHSAECTSVKHKLQHELVLRFPKVVVCGHGPSIHILHRCIMMYGMYGYIPAWITWVLGTGPLTKRLGCEMFIFSLCQVSILTTKEALFESHDQS
jgi:hypothetical protein